MTKSCFRSALATPITSRPALRRAMTITAKTTAFPRWQRASSRHPLGSHPILGRRAVGITQLMSKYQPSKRGGITDNRFFHQDFQGRKMRAVRLQAASKNSRRAEMTMAAIMSVSPGQTSPQGIHRRTNTQAASMGKTAARISQAKMVMPIFFVLSDIAAQPGGQVMSRPERT